jgi:hypothetical protein
MRSESGIRSWMRHSPLAECVSRCDPLGNEMTFLGVFEVGFTDGEFLGISSVVGHEW